jgi:hypothetical protein
LYEAGGRPSLAPRRLFAKYFSAPDERIGERSTLVVEREALGFHARRRCRFFSTSVLTSMKASSLLIIAKLIRLNLGNAVIPCRAGRNRPYLAHGIELAVFGVHLLDRFVWSSLHPHAGRCREIGHRGGGDPPTEERRSCSP